MFYLGEINDSPKAAWRKTLEIFDEDRGRFRELSLSTDDRHDDRPGTCSGKWNYKIRRVRQLLEPR